MLWVVLLIFIAAVAAPFVARGTPTRAAAILAVVPLVALLAMLRSVPSVAAGEAVLESWAWVPMLDVPLSFRLDGLSMLMGALIVGVGALIVPYAGAYLKGDPRLGRLLGLLLAFMGSMLGLVLADGLIAFFVFWELTSICSYLLIGFDHERLAARKAALQALLVTGGGGLALLAGLILLGISTGHWEITALLQSGDVVRDSGAYGAILILVLLGAFTKSAQWPFHFWLPGAMEAPTPVSAYLHSATMVKAGVYLLARFSPILGGTTSWQATLTIFGGVTLVVAALLAYRQFQLKRLLAYSTVASLGVLTMLLGLDAPKAAVAAMIFLAGHACYKAALFMTAGSITHATHEKDVRVLGGLRHAMPLTAIGGILAAASMVGLPPLLGYVGKESLVAAALQTPWAAIAVPATFVGAALLVSVAVIVGFGPFLGTPRPLAHEPHEGSMGLWIGPIILAGAGLVGGLLLGPVSRAFLLPAAAAINADAAEISVKLFHGIDAAFIGDILILLGGALLVLHRRRVLRWIERFAWIDLIGPERGYDLAYKGLIGGAALQTRLLQSGYLRRYAAFLAITLVLLMAVTIPAALGDGRLRLAVSGLGDLTAAELIIGLVLMAGAIGVVVSPARLTAVAALGAVGVGIALVFAMRGAPDLAITQVLVEVLTVILFVFVLYRLPSFRTLSSRGTRIRDMTIASTVGIVMTIAVLLAAHQPVGDRVATAYYAETAVPGGYGRNVVNVILVDFRALDTLGEIVVLALAAVGVFALLGVKRLRRAASEEDRSSDEAQSGAMEGER